jgi:hypothetical protein
VTPPDRLLCALVATFAPERAAAVAGRLAPCAAPSAVAHAVWLAATPRRQRLAALSSALTASRGSSAGEPRDVAGSFERRAVASVLATVRGGGEAPLGVSPALVRLCRERCRD